MIRKGAIKLFLYYIVSGADTPTNANELRNVILTASIRATCAFVFSVSSDNTFSAL